MSFVYFVSCGPSIKIGTSVNVKSRLASLQTSTQETLALIASIPGDVKLEQSIHRDLAKYRQRGEWFLDCKEVRHAICELCGSDVFTKPPQPTPLPDIRSVLEPILHDKRRRLLDFASFCFEDSERNRKAKIWKLHVTKRHLIPPAIGLAQRGLAELSDVFLLGSSDMDDIQIVGRAVASVELCECHVEIILGEDAWFLDGWERKPRANPLFETLNGKVRWQTFEEAVAAGWVSPPDSLLNLTAPWFEQEIAA
jgi:hypothetical protein